MSMLPPRYVGEPVSEDREGCVRVCVSTQSIRMDGTFFLVLISSAAAAGRLYRGVDARAHLLLGALLDSSLVTRSDK